MKTKLGVSNAEIALDLVSLAETLVMEKPKVLVALASAYARAAVDHAPVWTGNYVYNFRLTTNANEGVYDDRYKRAWEKYRFLPMDGTKIRVPKPQGAREKAYERIVSQAEDAVNQKDVSRVYVYNLTPYAGSVENKYAVGEWAAMAALAKFDSIKDEFKRNLKKKNRAQKAIVLGGRNR